MSAFIAKIISLIMAVLAFFGITFPGKDAPVVEEPGVYVTAEDEVKVVLDANPTTGYEWTYKFVKGSGKVTSTYVADDETGTVVGGGGKTVFIIVPDGEGEYEIAFEYSRSFEKDSVIRTSSVEFRVDAENHVYLAN